MLRDVLRPCDNGPVRHGPLWYHVAVPVAEDPLCASPVHPVLFELEVKGRGGYAVNNVEEVVYLEGFPYYPVMPVDVHYRVGGRACYEKEPVPEVRKSYPRAFVEAEPVEPRHVYVGYHEVVDRVPQSAERVEAVCRAVDRVPFHRQGVPVEVPYNLFIIDNKYLFNVYACHGASLLS